MKKVTDSERKNVVIASKSIIVKTNISKGEVFTEGNITTKRPGNGISPMCWNDVSNYGNTVSNSIPITLCDMLEQEKPTKSMKVLLCGFGVGLSWGGCVVEINV